VSALSLYYNVVIEIQQNGVVSLIKHSIYPLYIYKKIIIQFEFILRFVV